MTKRQLTILSDIGTTVRAISTSDTEENYRCG